jgi:hypothetical protein
MLTVFGSAGIIGEPPEPALAARASELTEETVSIRIGGKAVILAEGEIHI